MKGKITLIAGILSLLFASCSSSRNLTSTKQDKELFNAINAVEKSNNTEAKKDLPVLYQQAVQRHEDQIASFKTSEDPERWNSIIGELEALQKIYGAINASSTVSKLVSAQNYSMAIADARKTGAEEYYERGLQYLQSEEREDARKAYQAFQAVNRIYPNYRDASALQKKAEEKGILDVVINPVETRGYMYAGGSFAADNFQRSLVRDLGGNFGNTFSGARFYTDWDARSKKIKADWVIDLNWSSMYISPIRSNSFSRNVSKEIQTGKDADGKPIYQTVSATLYITQTNINAQADMEYHVTDINGNQNIE